MFFSTISFKLTEKFISNKEKCVAPNLVSIWNDERPLQKMFLTNPYEVCFLRPGGWKKGRAYETFMLP
jgi:hypothetical protein